MRENPSQKGDKSMNNIINQLSQIEEKTVAILDGAADKKKTLAAEYEAKTKQFDEELNHETELEIQSMRQKMEADRCQACRDARAFPHG